MASILYDGQDLFRSGATGIATYSRVLGNTAVKLGHRAQVVVSSNAPLDRKDPVLREVAFHEMPRNRGSFLQSLGTAGFTAKHFLMGSPFGIRPMELPRTGTVIDPSAQKSKAFDTIYVDYRLFDKSRLHFIRHNERATLKMEKRPNLFHATHPASLRVQGIPNIYTIHDIVPVRLPYTSLDNKKYFVKIIRHLCRVADHIVTVSEFSRRDIIAFTGISEDRITNTYQSVHISPQVKARAANDVADDLANIYGLGYKEYFLFFGALEPKKNVGRLIDAYAASGSKRPLILAGGLGWQYDDVVQQLTSERFERYRMSDGLLFADRPVRRLPFVPSDYLMSLIRGARAVLFPSLYEGFGLPVLEAMALGTPVVTSTAASLPEVAGDAAILVDPTDTMALTRAIRDVDSDTGLCDDLARRGLQRAAYFSSEAYEARIAALYGRFIT